MPSEDEIRSAFKKETGKEPTPQELEDFKRQAGEPATRPSDAEIK